MSYCIINILANTTVLREFHCGEVVAKRLDSTDLLKTVRTNTQNLCGLQFRVEVAVESVSVSTSAVKDTEITNFWIYIQHPVDSKLIKIRSSGARPRQTFALSCHLRNPDKHRKGRQLRSCNQEGFFALHWKESDL